MGDVELAGACVAGMLSDRYGRKNLLLIASVLFTASAIGTGTTDALTGFIVCRLLGGIGIASSLSPMYIAEMSPSTVRGRFMSISQLIIVVGILAAQITNYLIAEPVGEGIDFLASWNVQQGWRWMFWAETLPVALFFMLMFVVPESPRWMLGDNARARKRCWLVWEVCSMLSGSMARFVTRSRENRREVYGSCCHLRFVPCWCWCWKSLWLFSSSGVESM